MSLDFNSDLTLQQQAFVDAYLVDFNAVNAAIVANYSRKSVASQASQLLGNPKIQAEILNRMKQYGEQNRILRQRVVNQLCHMAFSDMRDFISWDKNDVVLKDSALLTNAQAAAIVEIKLTSNKNGKVVKVKLAPKEKSLELLGRTMGMFAEESHVLPSAPDQKKVTFKEFCARAGYPDPYPKQDEMREFAFGDGARLLLGSRGIGKSDYTTICGTAYQLYLDPEFTCIVVSKVSTVAQAMVIEIGRVCEANGVQFQTKNSKKLVVAGLQGKDASVEALSISSSFRSRHPKKAILDDIVTPEDTSEAVREKAKKVYAEVCKLTPNVLLIGQPVHKYDLYEELRPILKQKMEVPHGTLPELDADLEAMRLAGVDAASISASYHLKILSEGATPFDKIRWLKAMPPGHTVAFIDPAFEGIDYTALTILRMYMQGVAVVGYVWKKSWDNCLQDIAPLLVKNKTTRLAFETNSLGTQPLEILRAAFPHVGVVGRKSNTNKHSRIMQAGAFAGVIHLSKESHPEYISQVTKYEYKAKNDDAPDSLASCLNWIGLIRGKI